MNTSLFKLLTIRVAFFLLMLSTVACSDKIRDSEAKQGQISILATTGIIEDALLNIVKGKANVRALMQSGVDPHLFKPALGDVKKLTSANIIFYNGLHLEGKMGEVIRKTSRFKTVVAVADGVPKDKLRKTSQFAGNYDPHIWFDVRLWGQAVRHMSYSLQRLDTANAAYYKANTDVYLRELAELESFVRKEMAQIPPAQRVLITAHDAFGYFGDTYGIRVVALLGMSTLSDFGLKDVTTLVDFIVDNKIKAVFVESSVPKRSIEAVIEGARSRGHIVKIGGTLYSDALGEKGTPEGTYIGMVKANVRTIVQALK